MSDNVSEVTDAVFEAEVLQAGTPVLVDFWAPWCGPCRTMAPIRDEIADEHNGRLQVKKLNVDSNQVTARKYDGLRFPTRFLFKCGWVKDKPSGASAKKTVVKRP